MRHLAANDIGDLLFERPLGIEKDGGLFDGLPRIRQQRIETLLPLFLCDLIPVAIFILKDFHLRLLDGVEPRGRQGNVDGFPVIGHINGDRLPQIKARFCGEASFDIEALRATKPSGLDRVCLLKVFSTVVSSAISALASTMVRPWTVTFGRTWANSSSARNTFLPSSSVEFFECVMSRAGP